MKKIIVSVLLLSHIIPINVFANGLENGKEPGLTPNSPFYFLDKWVENIQYFLVRDDAKKAQVLLDQASERLAEAEAMEASGDEKYLEKSISEYLKNINDASEKIAEMNIEDETEEELSDLEDNLGSIIEDSDEIEERLPESIKKEMKEEKTYSYTKANVIKNIDKENVTKLKEEYKLGLGIIAKLQILSSVTSVDVEELAIQLKDVNSFAQLAKLYNFKISDLYDDEVETPEDNEETTPEDNEETTPEDNEETTPEDNEETNPEDNEETNPEDNEETNPEDNEETTPEDNEETTPEDNEETNPEDNEVIIDDELLNVNIVNLIEDFGNLDLEGHVSGVASAYDSKGSDNTVWSLDDDSKIGTLSQKAVVGAGGTSLQWLTKNQPYLTLSNTVTKGDVVYFGFWGKTDNPQLIPYAKTSLKVYDVSVLDLQTIISDTEWTWYSSTGILEYDVTAEHIRPTIYARSSETESGIVWVDGMVYINLTDIYGVGNEPSIEQMDRIMEFKNYTYEANQQVEAVSLVNSYSTELNTTEVSTTEETTKKKNKIKKIIDRLKGFNKGKGKK